ncbi:MAG: gliding motility-associated-like protein [Bacteroidia bacterium]|jgi:gliding motility-associated-like protein
MRFPNYYKLLFIGFLAFFSSLNQSSAQSTEGTDFWLSFLPHTGGGKSMFIYLSTKDSAVVTVDFPNGTDADKTFFISPNSTEKIEINSIAGLSPASGIEQKGIRIMSDNGASFSAYALNRLNTFSADATVLLPTFALGKEYFLVSEVEGNFPSVASVLATESNTRIEITPTVSLISGQPANVPFTVTLNEGQTFLISSNQDLTGTRVTGASSSGSSCNNFAVFSGTDRTRAGSCSNQGLDHLFQQLYPTSTWGTSFIAVPYQRRISGDFIKIIAAEDATIVNIGGMVVTLNKGDVWPNASQETNPRMNLTSVTNIVSDKPISVNQFSTSIPCDTPVPVPNTNLGDPFLITLSPNEQLLKNITFSAFDAFPVASFFYYTDIITPTNGVSSLKFDGVDISGDFNPVPGNPSYSFAQLPDIGNGAHTINSDSGFIAYVYGYGEGTFDNVGNPVGSPFESFGYATGASLENLNIPLISVDSGQVVVGPTDTLCIGNEIVFFPEIDTTVYKFFSWKMGDGTVYNTKDIVHTYTEAGQYLVEFNASILPDDCGSNLSLEGSSLVTVIKPTFSDLGPLTACPNTDSILYTIRNAGPFNVGDYKWTVGGGTIITDPMNDSILVNWGAANPNAYLLIESSNTYGCMNTDSIPIVINNRLEPEIPFGADTVCFDDLSQSYEAFYANGNFYKWFADGGTLTPDASSSGEHKTNIVWDPTAPTHRIWYSETNIKDTVCSGISDKLDVLVGQEIQGAFSNKQDVTCIDGADGKLQFTPSGGTNGIVSSIWSHDVNLTNLFPQNLTAGDYSITATDGIGCSVVFSESISQPDTFVVNINASDSVCFGANDGEIEVTVLSGATQPYTFGWVGLNSSASFTFTATTTKAVGLDGGNYRFTIGYNGTCTYTSDVITIVERELPTFTIAGEAIPCNFISRGYKASNPDLDYTWNVNGGTIMADLGDSIFVTWGSATTGAFVEARGEDNNGCFTNLTRNNINIFELNPVAPVGRNQICFNDLDSILYTLTPDSIYNYQWFVQGGTIIGSNVEDSIYVKWDVGTPPSRFVYYIQESNSDAICNFNSDTLFIADDLVDLSATFNMDSANCFGEASGELTVLPVGDAVGSYSYEWQPNVSSSNIATNLTAGIYTVEITDALGCSISVSETVLQPDTLISQITSIIDTTCFGEGQGRIEVDVLSGGTPSYVFDWIGTSNFSSTPTKTTAVNLPKGVYRYEIKDNNGKCTFTSAPIEIIERPLITFNISGDDLVCNGVTRTYTADTEEFTYEWFVEGGTIAGSNTLDSVIITWGVANTSARVRAVAIDKFGCSSDTTNFGVEVFELEPLAPVGRTQLCFNDLSGLSYNLPVSADPEYDYVWEVNGGTITSSNVGSNILVDWSGSATNRIVFYTQISNKPGDASVCQFTSDTLEIQDALVTLSATLGTDPVKCFGDSTGSVFVTSISPTGVLGSNYFLDWQHDSSIPNTQDTLVNLPIGTYTVIITDSLGCSITESETITQPDSLDFLLVDIKDLSCFEASNGQANGEITVSTTGGVAPYSYLLFDGTDTVDVDNSTDTLVVGTYLIEVTDANGCQKFIDNLVIGQPDEPIFGVTGDKLVCGSQDGTGPAFPYQAQAQIGYDYTWSSLDGQVVSPKTNPTTVIWGIDSLVYELDLLIEFNDGRGGTCAHDTTVISIPNFEVANLIIDEPNCADSTNGSIEIVMTDLTNIYKYDWAPFTSDSSKLVNIGTGDYTIIVSSETPITGKVCAIERKVFLDEPTKVGIRKPISVVAALCNGDENASFRVFGTGGTPGYSYLWENSDGDTIRNSNLATGLAAGDYKVIILDDHLCEFDTVLFVSQPDSLEADADSEFTPTYCQANTGSVELNPSGGTPPFTFFFDSGQTDGNLNFNLRAGGPWRGIITDKNGCKDTTFYEIKLEVPEVEFAEAFTPNNDGINDLFGPVISCPNFILGSDNTAPTVAFKVYDRYGNLIYSSTNPNDAQWNGKIEDEDGQAAKGKKNAPSGRYNYFIDYRITLDGIPYHIIKEGSVLLLK